MAVETGYFPRGIGGHSEKKPIDPTTQLIEESSALGEKSVVEIETVPEHVLPFVGRAAAVEYHSRRYLLPRDLTEQQYGRYLVSKGLSKPEIDEKKAYAYQFLTDITQQGRISTEDAAFFSEEDSMLVAMYQNAAATIKSETVDNLPKYVPPLKRIAANNVFIQNLLAYSLEQRDEILQSMGFSKDEMKDISINLAKATASTVAVNVVDGPVLDAVGLFLGKVLGDDFADYVQEAGSMVKVGVRAGAVGSAIAYYGSRVAKTVHTERAIRNRCYLVPNVFVAVTAMANEKMISPKERKFWTRASTLIAEACSPQSLVDEKWLATTLLGDNGITYAAGNLAATVSNFVQIGIVEGLIQYKKYRQWRHKGKQSISEEYVEGRHNELQDPIIPTS